MFSSYSYTCHLLDDMLCKFYNQSIYVNHATYKAQIISQRETLHNTVL